MGTHNAIWNLSGTDDPTVTSTPAPIGAQYSNTLTGVLYTKTGPGDTDWTALGGGASFPDITDTPGTEVVIGPVSNGGGPATVDIGEVSTGGIVVNADRMSKTYNQPGGELIVSAVPAGNAANFLFVVGSNGGPSGFYQGGGDNFFRCTLSIINFLMLAETGFGQANLAQPNPFAGVHRDLNLDLGSVWFFQTPAGGGTIGSIQHALGNGTHLVDDSGNAVCQYRLLINNGTGTLTLTNEDAGEIDPTKRLHLPGGVDKVIPVGGMARLVYLSSTVGFLFNNRWWLESITQ